jgi:glycerol kinase
MRQRFALSDRQLLALLPEHDEFQPDMQRHLLLKESYLGWQQAVQRTLWQPELKTCITEGAA